MFDNIASNKYLIIALLIALIVVLYLYNQKKSCDVEGMSNISFDSGAPELTETPWTDDENNDGKYKLVNNSFDRYADQYVQKKTGRGNFLKRKDEMFNQYDKDDDVPALKKQTRRKNMNRSPKPVNDRQDLEKYQSCICPQTRDDDESDDDDEYFHSRRSKNKRLYRKN